MSSSVATENDTRKVAAAPVARFLGAEFTLRTFILATSVAALVVELTSKQTEPIAFNPRTGLAVYRQASYTDSPALVYLVAALATTCFYGVLTLAVSAADAIKKPARSTTLLLHLAVLDVLMAGVMASATGAGGAVAYIGLKGNSKASWIKICKVYDKYCRHIGSAVALSLVVSIALVLLIFLNLYTLSRRCR